MNNDHLKKMAEEFRKHYGITEEAEIVDREELRDMEVFDYEEQRTGQNW